MWTISLNMFVGLDIRRGMLRLGTDLYELWLGLNWYDCHVFVSTTGKCHYSTFVKELFWLQCHTSHYNDVIMSAMASQITSLTIVNSMVYSGADQIRHQSSASLAFASPVNSPHKGPVTRKIFIFDDVIMDAIAYTQAIYVRMNITCSALRARY